MEPHLSHPPKTLSLPLSSWDIEVSPTIATISVANKPDVLDDEETNLLVLLVAELELLLVGLLVACIRLHCFLGSIILNCGSIFLVEINIWLVNPGRNNISYFSSPLNTVIEVMQKNNYFT